VTTISEGGAGNIFVGIFMVLVGLAFGFCALLDLFLLIRIHKIYRSSGASFAKAQQEFASGVMRNEHVQGAAANMAGEAIRQQFRGATAGAGNNGAPGPQAPRY